MVTPDEVWKAGSRTSRGRMNRDEGALRDKKGWAVGKKISGVTGERALRALPGKSARRSTTSRSRESDRAARSRSRTSEGEDSLWESAIRLRSGASD